MSDLNCTTGRRQIPPGVMLNAYPDSMGGNLQNTICMLKRPEFAGAFSLFYLLPTFFNSDLDRGFSIIDYDLNCELVSGSDPAELQNLKIMLKLDLILNHLSVNAPQFQDLLQRGDASPYRDFFIDWNAFLAGNGTAGPDGCLIPKRTYLQKLFMRKPGLPVMRVRFPDGSDRFFWNTFYQEITYDTLAAQDLDHIPGLSKAETASIACAVNAAVAEGRSPFQADLEPYSPHLEAITEAIEKKRRYYGQLDLNARAETVWHFYDQTLEKLRRYGAKVIRLDAFAYLHKEPGQANFFNRPGTWEYLERLKEMAGKYDLVVFPEIHAEYGSGLHEQVAARGYPIYDFFFPGLIIDALERGTAKHLLRWIGEIMEKGYETINMLGCHDGIPVLDLKGKESEEFSRRGLLEDTQIDAIVDLIVSRGGRVKNLYGPDGRKISYYQVNATFFSALGEDENKLLLARAIQLFMPGVPQIWYLDLFAGKNNEEAADRGGIAGHKEINRTNLSISDLEEGLKKPVVLNQLEIIRLRNTSPAFEGKLTVAAAGKDHLLTMAWENRGAHATLYADLKNRSFRIEHGKNEGETKTLSYR